MEAAKETKFGPKVGDEDDARTSNTRMRQRKRMMLSYLMAVYCRKHNWIG